jgi:hypothetical protein
MIKFYKRLHGALSNASISLAINQFLICLGKSRDNLVWVWNNKDYGLKALRDTESEKFFSRNFGANSGCRKGW